MSQPDPTTRPSQVTVAGWAVAVASVLLVLAVFDAIGKLDTVDMRERLSEVIDSGSLKGLGFTVGDAIDVMRWCLYVSGVAAAASAIFGVFVLQGHRGARIGLTVAAVAIVLTASFAGSFTGFLALFVGVSTGMLWTRPARDWFAGRPITPPAPPRPVERRSDRPAPPAAEQAKPVAWSPPAPGSALPPPTPGWGQTSGSAPEPLASWPAPSGRPVAGPVAGPVASSARPPQVRLACILTWVFSSLTAFGYAVVLVVMATERTRFTDELQKSPGWRDSFDVDTVTTLIGIASAVFVVWSLGAIVLALLVWRRVRWAWVALLVSAWTAGLLSVVAFPFSLPYLAVIGATAGMLMRGPSRAWFSGPTAPSRPQPPGPRPPVW